MGITEFESEWVAACEEYSLQDKLWAIDMYERRRMWANAYLRDKFCAGYRTTSRCDGINAYANKFSKVTHTILEMVKMLKLVVREYRNREMLLHFKLIYTMPVMTTVLRSIEESAGRIYTREMFADVKREIEGVGAVNLVDKRRCLNTMVYRLEEYDNTNNQIMSSYGRSTGKLDCECYFWNRQGIPCRHMFFVIKAEHVKEIWRNLILKRWRVDAKDPGKYVESCEETTEHGFLLRHGALNSASQWLFFLGAHDVTKFRMAMDGVLGLCRVLEADYRAGAGAANGDTKRRACVRDPDISKPKGAPKQAKKNHRQMRLCSRCKLSGHTKRNCPSKKKRKRSDTAQPGEDVEEGGQVHQRGMTDEVKGAEIHKRNVVDEYTSQAAGSVTSGQKQENMSATCVRSWSDEATHKILEFIRGLEEE